MKKKITKKKKIRQELNSFIKKNKEQILSRGREDLGDISDEKIIKVFKANYEERLEGKKLTLSNAREAMQKTLHTETFTGSKIIDIENLKTKLIEDKSWETFRKLNRHQKVNLEDFSRDTPPSGMNIRKRWKYETAARIIYIDLMYNQDGSYSWSIWRG